VKGQKRQILRSNIYRVNVGPVTGGTVSILTIHTLILGKNYLYTWLMASVPIVGQKGMCVKKKHEGGFASVCTR
jgi:hypothetical protein